MRDDPEDDNLDALLLAAEAEDARLDALLHAAQADEDRLTALIAYALPRLADADLATLIDMGECTSTTEAALDAFLDGALARVRLDPEGEA